MLTAEDARRIVVAHRRREPIVFEEQVAGKPTGWHACLRTTSIFLHEYRIRGYLLRFGEFLCHEASNRCHREYSTIDIVPGSVRTLEDIRVEPPDDRPACMIPEDFYTP